MRDTKTEKESSLKVIYSLIVYTFALNKQSTDAYATYLFFSQIPQSDANRLGETVTNIDT